MKRLSAIFVSLILPLTSFAQGVLLDDLAEGEVPAMPELRQYSVEVIVFAYAEDVHTGTEIFVPELLPEPELPLDENGFPILAPIDGEPIDGQSLDADETAAEEEIVDELPEDGMTLDEPEVEEPVTFTFELMVEEDYELLDTLSRLDELDAYEPLMHFGWVQGMLPDIETEVLALETFSVPPNGLQGAFTLYLSRYLHLVVDLELAADREAAEFGDESSAQAPDPFQSQPDRYEAQEPEPVPTYSDRRMFGWEVFPEPEEPQYAPLMYQISEDRIVRNGEIRYYDHPKFGVIARVVRIEADEEEIEEPEDSEQDVVLPASALAQ